MRRVIKIDEEKCDGCGICAGACHEGAIAIQNGKAKLISEIYCDGLGNRALISGDMVFGKKNRG